MCRTGYRPTEMGVTPLKKHPPARGKCGRNHEFAYAIKYHTIFLFARRVYALPGEFCYFLRPALSVKHFFKIFLKKWCLAGSWRTFNSNFGGKGENHRNPPQKGGEKMETIPRNDFILRHRYDAFCKAVLRNEAKSYWSEMAHRHEREKSLDALTQEEMDKLSVVDDYPSDSYVFSSYGYDLLIDNELVAEAFASLPEQEQSILILHCVLDLADGEIGSLMGMSRSAVQRHRTRTLKQLRMKLMAFMPEGGKRG